MSVDEDEEERLRQKLQLAVHLSEALRNDAKYFLETGRHYQGEDEQKCGTYLRASIITAFVALEAWVNTLSYLLAEHDSDLELHERAFLQEQELKLDKAGYFVIRGQQYRGLEEKVRFFHWRFKGAEIDKKDPTWAAFEAAKSLRNSIVHPRPGRISYEEPSVTSAESALKAVSEVIEVFLAA
jgi:hypothetical protein